MNRICNSLVGKRTESGNDEKVSFMVIFNREKHEVCLPLDYTVAKLKSHIQRLTGVPASFQKIMYKGLAKDELTLRDLKVVKDAKLMVIGSTMKDVLSISASSAKAIQAEDAPAKVPLSEQKQHKNVLDKYGKPDVVPAGIKSQNSRLPPTPLYGMYNKNGSKLRITFKLEANQFWIGTKDKTDKIQFQTVKALMSQPIKGHEEYHIMGLQMGPTEASRYWIYWVPAQFVEAMKDAILED